MNWFVRGELKGAFANEITCFCYFVSRELDVRARSQNSEGQVVSVQSGGVFNLLCRAQLAFSFNCIFFF